MATNNQLGHRERVKKRFLKEGLENFEPHIALELLLFYSNPRKDTKPIAYELLEKFGSFSAVLEAPFEELIKIKGVGENTATMITMMTAYYRYYFNDKQKETVEITSVDMAGEYLMPKFIGKTNEIVYVVCLNNQKRVVACEMIEEGTVNSTNLTTRKIVELAIRVGATDVILSHNHPQGIALPSKEDVFTTKKLKKDLEAVSLELIDHIIVDKKDFMSMKQMGYF